MTIEIQTALPAWSAAACPVRTKMPAPMIPPMPIAVSAPRPSVRWSPPVASASARRLVMDLVAQRLMRCLECRYAEHCRMQLEDAAGDASAPPFLRYRSGRVVRGLAGDGHVVRVGLAEPRTGDLDELGLGAEGVDGADAAVPHPAPQPADELI